MWAEGEVVATLRGGTLLPLDKKKKEKLSFKNGTQQLALATFHHILLHST